MTVEKASDLHRLVLHGFEIHAVRLTPAQSYQRKRVLLRGITTIVVASAASKALPNSGPGSSNAVLADQCIVLSMRSYPEPQDPVGGVNTEGAIVQADADGMKTANPLEVE